MAYEALYTRGRPKTFSQLVGQEHISNALTRAINSDRLSHAYLLVGTRGTGKTSTARLLAKAMNCERVYEAQTSDKTLSAAEIPCNKCSSCLSIDSSPDNVEFDAASNRSVEDVTRLLSTAHLAPLQSRIKTFIIDEVHMLSFEAVNSILKLIEEPPPNVAFFLATTELQKVPMTIRSRCQVLNFRLIPQETIANHLKKFAERLKVELDEDAAKKIARLAEGSMRDALTYLDQCYSMADKKISLDDVNQTLGLISDADLDKIISAVKSQNREAVGRTLNHAFRSGLSSITIAESLITRLRDWEFSLLGGQKADQLPLIESFVEELRKTILEMQGSGIPDIILEMALMKFSAPKVIFTQPAQAQIIEISSEKVSAEKPEKISSEKVPVEEPEKISEEKSPSEEKIAEQTEKTSENESALAIDETSKIFYDILEALKKGNLTDILSGLQKSKAESFSANVLTISFPTRTLVRVFLLGSKELFENWLSEDYFKKNVRVEAIVEGECIDEKFGGIKGGENLKAALKFFHAEDFQKISDEE